MSILHLPTVKPLDEDELLRQAKSVQAVVTVEEHSTIGGLGSACAEALAESGLGGNFQFRRIGIPDVFPDQYGSQASLMARYGIDSQSVVSVVRQLLN